MKEKGFGDGGRKALAGINHSLHFKYGINTKIMDGGNVLGGILQGVEPGGEAGGKSRSDSSLPVQHVHTHFLWVFFLRCILHLKALVPWMGREGAQHTSMLYQLT